MLIDNRFDPTDRERIHNWLNTNNFCAMPFYHVAIESNGDVRPCCLGSELRNEDGTRLNISDSNMTVADVIKHPTHIKFRQSFLNNEQHPACQVCWGDYHNDRFSGRHVYSTSEKVNKDVEKVMLNTQTAEQKLLWLEIKAGNRCNLACRICGLWNSAKWLKETYDMKKQQYGEAGYPEFKSSAEFKYNQQAKWIDNIDFWRNIDNFDDIKIIHIMGGEPMMIDEHFEMLKAIANKFDAGKIVIWYNTNGTTLPSEEQEAILAKFKKIIWSVSIDDCGDKFDYQRSGATWTDVKEKLPYFFNKGNYEASIDATISIFNITTIYDFVKELDTMGLSSYFMPHYVTTPGGHTNVRTLHKDIKEKIKTQLLENQNSINSSYTRQVTNIINFMMNIDEWSDEIDRRRRFEIDQVDRSRNESFVKTFPEMSKLLNYE